MSDFSSRGDTTSIKRAPSRAIRSCSAIAACRSGAMESRFEGELDWPDCLTSSLTCSISSSSNSARIGDIHRSQSVCRSFRRTVGILT